MSDLIIQTGLTIVWLNSNMAGHFKRSTAVGFVLSIGNTSGVVVGQVFKAQNGPRYLDGVRFNLGFTSLAIFLTIGYVFALRYVNARREQRLASRGPGATSPNGSEERGVTDWDDDFRYSL